MKTARLNTDLLGNPKTWLLISTCQMMIKSIAILSLQATPHLPRKGLSICQISILQLYVAKLCIHAGEIDSGMYLHLSWYQTSDITFHWDDCHLSQCTPEFDTALLFLGLDSS